MTQRALNPNQFALPGMEHVSPNPMAPYLDRVQVAWGNNRVDRENEIVAHDPGTFPYREHRIGVLQWGDSATNMSYPGEIAWVENVAGFRKGHSFKGIATALYHTANKMADADQFDTKPIHSETLTHEGSRFRFKTGGPGHEDEIPDDYHAYQRDPHSFEGQMRRKKRERELHYRMGDERLPGL